MRSILLHIHDDDCLEARLQLALDLARAFDGHVTCLQALPFELGVPGDIYGTMAAELLPDIRERGDALRARLQGRLTGEDVAWNWIQEDGLAADQLLRRCGLSDIVVLGSCDPFGKGPAMLAGDMALRARMPVMIVPPKTKRFDCDGPAIVAWDGSPEASRALRGAVPLLAKSRSVVLATISGEGEGRDADLPATEGAEYLSRHGIGCEMTDLPLGDGSVAQGLVRAAVARDAAYLVMGAYGHSRLLETVFGGVTRELLAKPPLPILACH